MPCRTLSALLALATLLASATGVSAASSARTLATPDPLHEGFFVATGHPASLDFVVPSRGRVSFTIHVEAGAAADLLMDGPGACRLQTRPLTAAPAQPVALKVDCGVLQPMNVQLTLSTAAGALRGHVKGVGAEPIP